MLALKGVNTLVSSVACLMASDTLAFSAVQVRQIIIIALDFPFKIKEMYLKISSTFHVSL